MISPFFMELGLIVIVATLLGLLFSKLKQPIMLAYIATGIVLGAGFFNMIGQTEVISLFSEIGIAFLLYLIGLNLNLNTLKEFGRPAAIAGAGQIVITSIVTFLLAVGMGFGLTEALYLGIAFTFSSTIIIVKLLSDRNELDYLHGKMTLGILLVQDFVAIMALLFVGSMVKGTGITGTAYSVIFNGLLFLVLVALLAKYVIPRLFDAFAVSRELLFLGGVSWAFFLSWLSIQLGFSLEIGAFVAGVSLAHLPYSFEIGGKIRHLRDFFLVLFFVALGTQLALNSFTGIIVPALLFSLFIIIIQPLIVIAILRALGYKARTSFLTGLTMGMISEFSLILIALGHKAGHLSVEIVSLATLVGVITISISTYMISHGNRIYEGIMKKFHSLNSHSFFREAEEKIMGKTIDTFFLGFDKLGQGIFSAMGMQKHETGVIEFDPQLAKELSKNDFNCVFGDAIEQSTLEIVRKARPKLLISTIRDMEVSQNLLKEALQWNEKPDVVLTTDNTKHGIELYLQGASYVIIPQLLVGREISETIRKIRNREIDIEAERNRHLSDLAEMPESKMK